MNERTDGWMDECTCNAIVRPFYQYFSHDGRWAGENERSVCNGILFTTEKISASGGARTRDR